MGKDRRQHACGGIVAQERGAIAAVLSLKGTVEGYRQAADQELLV